jgi:ABC-2 type transport system ATP-binding protein
VTLPSTARGTRPSAATVAAAVSLRGARLSFGERTLWSGLDLDVEQGEFVAVLGPNGSGKTSLVRVLLGLETLSAGEVRIAGREPRRGSPHIGYIPQTPALYRELTVADHLDLAARLRPGFDRASAVSRLSALGIPARSRGGELSGGQQAQLTLAVALGSRADILLLDEPLASLDPLARHEFLVLLADVARERRATVLLSSHIVGELGGVCDRLVVLGVGRVLYEGSVADALATHRVRDALAGPDLVATFPSSDGAMHGLFRADDGRPATLDEIALGYLAAGRKPTSADLGWPAA